MDVESQATIDEAIERLNAESARTGTALTAGFEAAGAALVDRAVTGISNVVSAALNSLAATENKAALDAQAITASLDGWTLTIEPITIRLGKPKMHP